MKKITVLVFLLLTPFLVFSVFPKTQGWYAGDAHLHTHFGETAWENPGTFQSTYARAKNLDYDWLIFTEHSVAFDIGSQNYTQEIQECTNKNSTQDQPLCMVGQELSLYAGSNKQQHLLAYPKNNYFLEYLDGTCNDQFQLSNCRDAQETINEVNELNGMSFIAHPFHQGVEIPVVQDLVIFDWVSWGTQGVTGLEVFNASDNDGQWSNDDQQAFHKWMGLLLEETNPQDGFLVGIANSDAHYSTELGTAFTYCYMDSLTIQNVLNAYKKGHCVLSSGPLIDFSLNTARIGETAFVDEGSQVLSIKLNSNSQYGRLKKLSIIVDGLLEQELPLTGYSKELEIPIELENTKKFILLKAETQTGKVGVTNPIWLDFESEQISPSSDDCSTILGCFSMFAKKLSTFFS